MMNKSAGADEISFNVIKNCFGELSYILRYLLLIIFANRDIFGSFEDCEIEPCIYNC